MTQASITALERIRKLFPLPRHHRRPRPYEWRDKFSKSSGASRELKEDVAKKWKNFLTEKVG